MFSRFDRLREGLRRRYAEPHRVYHGQSHIDSLRAALVRDRSMFTSPDAVELAIWYHHAIYDPLARDNESASAELLRAELTGMIVPEVIDLAEQLVRATADHRIPPGLPGPGASDCALFLDMDLAILGRPPDEFATYEAGIEAEFRPHYDWLTYRAGRATVLRTLLQRNPIYLSAPYRSHYETAARDNIALALARYS